MWINKDQKSANLVIYSTTGEEVVKRTLTPGQNGILMDLKLAPW